MDLSELFVNDAPRSGARRRNIADRPRARVRNQLLHRLRLRIVFEQRHRAVAIGKKIDLAADPHRIDVVRIRAWNLHRGKIAQIRDPQVTRLAAAIPLPCHEVGEAGRELAAIERGVNQALAVGRISARAGHGQRQRGWQSAFGRYREKLGIARLALAVRAKQDALAVGSPAHHTIGVGMKRDPLRNAAAGGYRENVRIAVVFAGERDRVAIRRKRGVGFEALAGREPLRGAALTGHTPQIARVGKDNQVFI